MLPGTEAALQLQAHARFSPAPVGEVHSFMTQQQVQHATNTLSTVFHVRASSSAVLD